MTDGYGSDNKVEGILKKLRAQPKFKAFRFFCLAYGTGCDSQRLQKFVLAGNGGREYEEFEAGGECFHYRQGA